VSSIKLRQEAIPRKSSSLASLKSAPGRLPGAGGYSGDGRSNGIRRLM